VLIGIGLGWWPVPAAAQGGAGDLWQTFTVSDGLLANSVSAIWLAHDDTLWFGTDAGASHYDGRWESFMAADGLPAGRIRAIAQTADGALWFAAEAGGLGRRAPDGTCCRRWTTTEGLPDNGVRALLAAPTAAAADEQGGLWVGTAQGLVFLKGDAAPILVPALAGVPIWALAGDQDGTLWVGTAGRGVWQRARDGVWHTLDSGTSPSGGSALVAGDLFSLWVDDTGRIWVGTSNGLVYYEAGAWQRFPLLSNDTGLRVFAIVQDADGSLWIGTDQGCFYNNAASPGHPIVHLTVNDGLANDYVRALAFDRDNGLWLGTLAGVSRYDGNVWRVGVEGILADSLGVNTVMTDRAGRTWAGTEGKGLMMWDGTRWQSFTSAKDLPDDRVVALFEDRAGRIWAGTGSGAGYWEPAGGTSPLEGGTSSLEGGWHFYGEADGLVGAPVRSIGQDAKGDLWFGTNAGVSRWNATAGFQPVPELAGKRINAIYGARDGSLWFGLSDDGMMRLAEGQWQTPTTAGGSTFNGVVLNGIAEEPDGALWVGTFGSGLWRFADGQWQQIDGNLSSPLILSVAFAGGNLWVGTRVGLNRFDGQTWQAYVGSVLPGSEVNAVAPGTGGTFWIATNKGLVHYRPEARPPWVQIKSVNLIVLRNGAVTLTSEILREMHLVGGDMAIKPDDLQFLPELEGVPADSLQPRELPGGVISFGDLRLPPGSYVFRVRVRDAAFNYSVPAEVTIVVPRPVPMVKLPWGPTIPAGQFYSILALAVVALGGLTAAGTIGLTARARERRQAAALATRQREALARHFNPYISGEPVREADMFFGRHELLNKILNALHRNSIMIYGERRIGKTTLLYQLAEQLRQTEDPDWVFIPVSVDLEGTPQTRFFLVLMEDICGVLRAYLPEMPPSRFDAVMAGTVGDRPEQEYTDRHFSADLRALLDAVKTVVAPRNVRVILLIDEMDVIDTYDSIVQQQLRRIFMATFAENLGAVVAGIQISKAWDRVESPWYNMFNEIALKPFDDKAARQLLTEPVRGTYEWEPAALDFVIARAEGRPYRLQQYGLEAVNHMLAAGRLRITPEDVQAADEIIERARGQ
jgi:ligand-binding sensor domain-containing protein